MENRICVEERRWGTLHSAAHPPQSPISHPPTTPTPAPSLFGTPYGKGIIAVPGSPEMSGKLRYEWQNRYACMWAKFRRKCFLRIVYIDVETRQQGIHPPKPFEYFSCKGRRKRLPRRTLSVCSRPRSTRSHDGETYQARIVPQTTQQGRSSHS
jgi:hypothetical protein